MTDRESGTPGQYKAVITAAEFRKLQAGQPFVIKLVRDDHPVIIGTPFSKVTVLPDELAEKICPGVVDPTPADAFARLLPAIEDAENPGCFYRMANNEKEWVNPPMKLGVEYRITERWNDKPVYTKLVDFGRIPYNTSAYVAHNSAVVNVFRCQGTLDNGDVVPGFDGATSINLSAGRRNVWIRTYGFASVPSQIAKVQIWYTKDY